MTRENPPAGRGPGCRPSDALPPRARVRRHRGSGFHASRATNRFALFGEIMLIGLIASVLSLPLITLPLALAVSARRLRRYLKGEGSGIRMLWDDLKAGLGGGLLVGLGMLVLLVAGTVSLLIAPTDLTGFGTVMTVVAWIALAAVAVVLLMLAGGLGSRSPAGRAPSGGSATGSRPLPSPPSTCCSPPPSWWCAPGSSDLW